MNEVIRTWSNSDILMENKLYVVMFSINML